MNTRNLVQASLLIALAVALQAIRLIIPLPPLAGTIIIGSLVNMMLIVTYYTNGLKSAGLLVLLLPIFAYFQGQLLLPILIPIVIFGNYAYVVMVKLLKSSKYIYILPALAKTVCMFFSAKIILSLMNITGPAAAAVLFGMSMPQLVTGIIGVFLAKYLLHYLATHK